jgi:hypothetical protein
VAIAPDQVAAAERCSVHSKGVLPGGAPLWWLANEGAELVCTVNQRRLAHGEEVRLNDGDAIELGLLHFVIETYQAHGQPPHLADTHPANAPSPTPPTPPTASQGADAHARFELTDLLRGDDALHAVEAAAHTAAHARHHRQSVVAHADPFNDIADTAYRLDVAAPVTTLPLDPTAALPSPPGGNAVDGAITDPATGADETGETGAASAEVLRHLHAEYLRLMHNPNEPTSAMDWSLHDPRNGGSGPRGEHALHDLTQDAERFESLYDILGHGANIESIMSGLDTLTDTDLLADDPKVNVLRLFAPADLLMQEAGLPGLTRREHHALSADSAAALDPSRKGIQ